MNRLFFYMWSYYSTFCVFILGVLEIHSGFSQPGKLESYLLKNDVPLICGHRGGYYTAYPENTIALFDTIYKTAGENFIMFEIDIRESKDRTLVVAHDADLTRTAGIPDSIHILNISEFRKTNLLDQTGVKSHHHPSTLADVFEWSKDKNVFLMLDVKTPCWAKLGTLLNLHRFSEKCMVLTFSDATFREANLHLKNTLISTLVTKVGDENKVVDYTRNFTKPVLYVTKETPPEVLKKFKGEQFILLSDPRELYNNNKEPFDSSFYKTYVSELYLNVLVTDFPIEVNSFLHR